MGMSTRGRYHGEVGSSASRYPQLIRHIDAGATFSTVCNTHHRQLNQNQRVSLGGVVVSTRNPVDRGQRLKASKRTPYSSDKWFKLPPRIYANMN